MAQHRDISHSELGSALTCQAQHSFRYTGHLVPGGQVLQPRGIQPHLSGGRAWGAGVAAWHAAPSDTLFDMALWDGHAAIADSFRRDSEKMREDGVEADLETLVGRQEFLSGALAHYATIAEKLPNVTTLEGELLVPIPSRSGRRASTRYRFHGYVDAMSEGLDVVEFKFRDSLTDPEILQLERQPLRYAWAAERHYGIQVRSVIVEERLAAIPKPAKIVKAKRKGDGIDGLTVSHAVAQITTPEIYREACELYGVEPEQGTVDALAARTWQRRTRLMFRRSELEEAGRELVSAAKLINHLDSGNLYPIRNSKAMLCRGCDFKRICANPGDTKFVDMQFTRHTPKRLKAER
jgi:PD-(D/E)XK nuclease superfamily